MKNEQILQILKENLDKKDQIAIISLFDENRIVDMAEPVSELTVNEILTIFKLLSKEKSAQLFTYMSEDAQKALIDAFSGSQLQEMLENVYSDDIVDIIGDLPANLTKKILMSATAETRKEINLLLSFPEHSAGSIMSCDYFELKQYNTVSQAIEKLKKQGNTAETINYCFVIDEERRLVGSVRLENLLFEKANVLIKDIMDKNPISVQTLDDQEEVANTIRKYDIPIVPVVNDENRLIGIITVDDIMDIMEEEVTEDIHKMNAVTPLEDGYANSSVIDIVKSRLPWLLILMITNSFAEMIIAYYEASIMVIPVLIGFMPVIMDTAGNGGGQSSTVIIRSIATGDVTSKDLLKVVGKELLIGLMCSVIIFAVTFVRLYYFPSSEVALYGALKIALVVGGSMCIALIIGKMMGGLLPLLVNALHLDPASVASPIITTLSDTISLLIFFEIASIFFNLK